MTPNDLSANSSEDEGFNEGASRRRSESGTESIQLEISYSNDAIQINMQSPQKYGEAGHNEEFTKVSRSKVQNESLNEEEFRWGVDPIGDNSTGNIPLTVYTENMKTSESELSSSSSDVTLGSISPDSKSSEEEPVSDIQNIIQERDTERVWYLENPILALRCKAAKKISNSPSTPATYSSTNLGNTSQTTKRPFASAKGSSFLEDSNSIKTPDTSNSNGTVNIPPLPKRKPSKHIKATKVPPKIPLTSTCSCFVNIEEPSSSTTAVPPLVEKASYLNNREVETSDCGTTPGYVDCNGNRESYCQKEDKSVAGNFKTEPSISSKTDSFPLSSSAPSISNSSSKGGSSLLKISKSWEQTSLEADWKLDEKCDRSDEVIYFVPRPWVLKVVSKLCEKETSDAIEKFRTPNLLREVRNFFRKNRVDADVNMSWEERKHQIISSKYFSDAFSSRHGLLSHEEIQRVRLEDIKKAIGPQFRIMMELKALTKTLVERRIDEKTFTEYIAKVALPMYGREFDEVSISETCIQERQKYLNKILFPIKEEFGLVLMLILYSQLTYEGRTFSRIINLGNFGKKRRI